jgi:AAA+ ATPase superfamily predicted ATPase
MTDFFDRFTEIADLEAEYAQEHATFAIVFGRRRLGKTRLLREFAKDKPAIYFLATEEDEDENRTAFKNQAAIFTENTLLKNAEVYDWFSIFETIARFNPEQKKCIIIDEFQYLGNTNPAFPSIMQKVWDTCLKDANVMLILCGSLISMMYEQTLSYQSPLFGRRTSQFRIKQIPFQYYKKFFPKFTRKDLVEFYSVTGGVPRYIELVRGETDIMTAVKHTILSPTGFLYDEPNFLLQKEVSSIGTYFSIIKTIAAGNHKLGDIASRLNAKQSALTKYLNTLIGLDILYREVPVTELYPEKSRMGLYKIRDNFLVFWFKFVYPNLSYLETGNTKVVLQKLKTNFRDNHVAEVYEDICRAELIYTKKWPWEFLPNRIGRWWNKTDEIDIVALDVDGKNAVFGECKYRNKETGLDVYYSLEEKAALVDWNRDARSNYYVLFSINGFDKDLTRLAKKQKNILLLK